jgi:hypothetical protein
MPNMPNITPLEIAAVAAAVLLLCVTPAVVAWSDERQRRRLRLQATAALPAEPAAVGRTDATPGWYEPATPSAAADEPTDSLWLTEAAADAINEQRRAAPEQDIAAGRGDPIAPSDPGVMPLRPEAPDEAVPVPDAVRHRFQLQDLRRVRLRDWPPAAVRNDPARARVWHEAERVLQEHYAAISSTVLSAPHPAQSSCLGSAEEDGANLRLRFLLFPVLWPVSEDEAVAEAVFDVDRGGGEMRCRVERLKRQG